MNSHTGRAAFTISGAVAMLLAAAAAQAQETPANLNEVIVTAQKRAEALADIPMSVSVVAGEALARNQADNFQDLVSLVPGLSINTSTRGQSRISIRGINTGGVASTVGVYVDDVPFGSSSGLANGAILSGDFDTFDLARVEVLRGPQGTLYGASSLGGVIKYVMNPPSTEGFEGGLQATTETVENGDLGYSLAGALNMPVGESFAIRASGFYRQDDGFVDSIGNNPIPSLTLPGVNIVEGTRVEDDFNSLDTYGGRISALIAPSETFSLNLTALFQDINSDGSDTFEADPVSFEPLYGGLVRSSYHPEFTDTGYRIYSATLDWDLGPVSLQSVTSWGEFEQDFQRDLAMVASLSQVLSAIFGAPLSALQQQNVGTDKFTQELRLVSQENDSFEWMIGAYYTDEDSILSQNFFAVEAGTENPVTETPAGDPVPVLGDLDLLSSYQELAFFANATWHITEKFDLSFGGRWSDNEQEASQTASGLLVGPPTTFDDVSSSESPFTYSISPRLEIADNTSVYARVATGFRPGGPNVLPPSAPPGLPNSYDSDELTSYEIGLKTASDDGVFSLDVAAYFLDWEDIQLVANVNDFNINANGGTAESKGVELTATARATEGLSLTVTAAYTDAYLTEDTGTPPDDPVANPVGGRDGDPLPYVPEFTLGLGGDYEWSVFGDSTAYVGGQFSYVGERSADFSNRDAGGNIRSADSYMTVDLRTGILRDRWSIELYGKNLTDEEGVNNIQAPGTFPNGAVGISVIRPRTIGLSLGLRF